MTAPHSTNDLTSSEEFGHEQCMLYLFGELDAKQSGAFERQMESSPDLGEELLRQADVIAGLAINRGPGAVLPAPEKTISRWSLVASIVAIAACLAIAVLSVRPHSLDSDTLASAPQGTSPPGLSPETSRVTEDLLIARAWADSQLNKVWADSQLNDLGDDFGFAELEFEDGLAMAEDPSDIDSTLSWMFIAVSATADSSEAGAANDG